MKSLSHAAVAVFVCAGLSPAADRSLMTVDDLYRLDAPREAVLSPDNKTVVYVRAWIDPRTRKERFSLWRVDHAGKPAALEAGEPDGRSPVFSPDGRSIAFLSSRPRPKGWKQTPPVPPHSDAAVDVWLLPVAGGPAVPLAGKDKPYGRVLHDGVYGRLSFSRDGRKLAFVADDGVDPRTPQEIANDVEVVRPDQGEGYTGYGPAQVWVAHFDEKSAAQAAGRIDRLTRDDVWYGDPQWTPDGKTLVVHANRTGQRESVRFFNINRNFDLYAIDAESGKIRQLTHGIGPEVSPRVSADGKTVACLSVPRQGTHRDEYNLALVSLVGEPRTRILHDHHSGADKPPHPSPAFPLPVACWDGEHHLLYQTAVGTRTHWYRLDVRTGKSEKVDLAKKETHKADSLAGRLAQLHERTPAGNAFLKQRRLGASRIVAWKSDEGGPVEGILTLPPEGVGSRPFPTVVHPHGGPHSRSTVGFDFTVQVLAAQGYAVLQPNFRGSAGYGQKFIDANRFDFGGGDRRDILAGVDFLVRQGTSDPDRLFVYGISYGGFMTSWLVGQTHRFKAAVAQNAVTDLAMMWSLSDIPSWTEWEFGGLPWQVADRMRAHSPLSYAAKVKTPTLILHAREDRRCPLPMGTAFYRSLRAAGVETQMVIYPDEGHSIRQPRHREDVLRRLLAWFAQHDPKKGGKAESK